MNYKSKFIVIVFAIVVGILIYFCFNETIKFEKETSNFNIALAEYENMSLGKCQHGICTNKLYYRFPVKGQFYNISTRTMQTTIPKKGSKKLVKYDPENPNIAYFTKINEVYLFYLISFFFGFVVLWVIFAKPPRKPDYSIYRTNMAEEAINEGEETMSVVSDPNVSNTNTEDNSNVEAETKAEDNIAPQSVEYHNQSDTDVLYQSGQERLERQLETPVHVGQLLMGLLFVIVCFYFYIKLGFMVKTFNPIAVTTLTFPVGFVLIILTILSIFVLLWSLKKYKRNTKYEKFDIKSNNN